MHRFVTESFAMSGLTIQLFLFLVGFVPWLSCRIYLSLYPLAANLQIHFVCRYTRLNFVLFMIRGTGIEIQ